MRFSQPDNNHTNPPKMAKPEEARRSHDKAGKGKDGRQSKDKDKPFRRAKADDDADAAVLMSDERFAKIMRDPRFRKPKKDKTKVDIDERFSKMLDNEEFSYVGGLSGLETVGETHLFFSVLFLLNLSPDFQPRSTSTEGN